MRIIREPRISTNMKLLLLLLASILFMGIGYSAINSITGEIDGIVIAEAQEGVFITNVEYVSNVDANLATSEIKYYEGTMMQSSVQLSGTNSASEITYKVTVYNNSENSLPFLGVLYDEEFYDNENIIFEISEDGYSLGEFINPKESKDIYITFKYKDGVIPESTILNSYLNFKIAEPNRMVLAQNVSQTGNYLGSTVVKNTIETISFELGNIQPAGTVSSFDASEKQDESIMGYYTDTDGNGLYELTFASNEIIFANINASYLFRYLTNLKKITFDNFSTYGVTNMNSMFSQCSSLTSLDVSKFDTSQVTDMGSMFDFCRGLTNLDVSGFDTSQVTDMSYMFHLCSILKSLDVSNFDTSQVTNMSFMFSSCSRLTSLNVSNFDTSQVTNMNGMFYSCIYLTSLDVSKFDTSQVTNMSNMFSSCSGLTSLDLSKFDTSQVTNMSSMFYNCIGLTSLDLSKFDTSQVTNMSSMFYSCSRLTSLDVTSFDTSQVTNMNSMFYFCRGLTTIYVSEFDSTTNTGWTTSAVTNSSRMFNDCTKLVGGNGTTYDSSHIDKEYARIDTTETPGYFTNITDTYFKSPSELFDAEGTNPEGLHIGDFINYDAGTWTQEEIDAIQVGPTSRLVTANGSTSLPTTAFQFGGFTAGSSRNGNATPWESTYNYVKDGSTGGAITGWRVFDIEGDILTLISAGNPEDYYHPSGTNYVYITEYILTGNVNSSWSNGTTQAQNYQKRDWSNYINTAQKAESATVLTKSRLDEWYTRYTDTPNANVYTDATFRKIYEDSAYHKYQNMVDNYSYYWLSAAANPGNLYSVISGNRSVSNITSSGAFGVRVLVSLSSEVKFTAESVGTKTVTGGWTTTYGGDQTYNVWDIK